MTFVDEEDEDSAWEVHGATAAVAFLEGLAERGVVVEKVVREFDAEGCGMVAFKFALAHGGPLYAHFPGVPLAWLRRPQEFREERAAWDDEGNIVEMYIQHHGYVDWEKALDAGVRAAAGG
ncbi:hypothetical protein AB0E27_24645 [Streptomyces sparsogenes]|uniref:hypothetical protein n=1 Tax=Streptomyces sparsogenes TaxID=67365 RepID=UPI0033EF1AEF